MLVFLKHNLVFFALPKTGTTAYHAALRGKADIIFRGAPAAKHMNMRKYMRHVAPSLDSGFGLTPDRLAVMREPLDTMRSWYKYRSRLDPKHKNYTGNISFEQFLELALTDDPPSNAAVGIQTNFLQGPDGTNAAHHLFAYEKIGVLNQFLTEVFGDLPKIPRKNVSPEAATNVSDELVQRFRTARAADYALYQEIMAHDGYLFTEQADTPDS